MSFIQDLQSRYRNGDISIKLIFIISIMSIIFWLAEALIPYNIADYVVLSGDFSKLPYRVWTLLTYAFLHGNILHLAMNLIGLFFLGRLFFTYFRQADFLKFFVLGCLAGGLLFWATLPLLGLSNYFDSNISGLVGASAGVFAVLFALVAYSPKVPVQLMFISIRIPLDLIAYIFLGMSVLEILLDYNTGGNIAHLGGAAFGYFYMKAFERGNDFLGGIIDTFYYRDFNFKRPKRKTRLKTKKNKATPKNDYDYNIAKKSNQERVDQILDKISASGYNSLTKEEKEFLFKQK